MEDKIKEALNNAGITEEQLIANGEAAAKAMEDKVAEAAASVDTKEETIMNPATVNETVAEPTTTKSKVIKVLKWTGYCAGCIAVGIVAGLLIKKGLAKEAAEAATESAE